jgi:activator of Hsp90 ATPase-like protein
VITADSVRVTTVVRTDPAAAFRFFTDEIDAGRLMEDNNAIGRVLAWEPGVRLLLEWSGDPFGPGETTEVEVRFEAIGDGTRVTVEHRGWTRAKGASEFRTVVGLWWGALLPGFGRYCR